MTSLLMDFAAVCVIEQSVEAIFYHKRRDWQRMRLQWEQHMEQIQRTGRGCIYAKPIFPSIEAIRKQAYRHL